MTETIPSAAQSVLTRYARYNRRRPFLVIEVVYRPAKNVRTERRGWALTPENWDTFERHVVVDSITPRMLQCATIIIDVANGKVVKSRMGDEGAVVQHYLDKYRTSVVDGMQRWLHREAIHMVREQTLVGA